MEAVAAFSMTGTIAQFLQFSLDLFSRSQQLYRSSQGSLAEYVDAEIIAKDLLKGIKLLKAHVSLVGQDVDDDLKLLCDSCTTIAEELLCVLERVRLKGKHQKWPSFKAAILSVRTQPQAEDLKRRLDALAQEAQLYGVLTINYWFSYTLVRRF